MEKLVKFDVIKDCCFGRLYANDGWYYEVMLLVDKSTYRADLHGPDYDDFDWQYKDVEIQSSSPEFATKQEAIDYAKKEWFMQDHVVTSEKIDNCVYAQPDKNAEWYYEIIYLSNASNYRADLYGPDYNDTKWQCKNTVLLRSSPESSFLEDVILYALTEWINDKENK